jgi:NAD(P)H dehydrogenase (quinone)
MKTCFLPALLAAALAQLAPAAEPTRILIAYHSETGNTEKLAQAVQRGAASVEGVEAMLRKVAAVKPEEIVGAHGIVVGTPVHWSNLSVETKRFLDRAGDALWKAKTTGEGRTAGAFCTGGAPAMGKEMARLSILSAFLVMRFVVIGGVEAGGYGTLGPEATTGPPDAGVSEKELEEARRFGERFARLTVQLRVGAARKQ